MNLSEPFIRRPIGTMLLAIGVFLIGAGGRSFARAKGDYSTGR